ncbi:tetratricopeptide repeat protein [Actinoallomurus sp. NPDC050550]|uniref:tetratricopeptide repeat protein n=1 Tax=Actinoallomurus sp. NPDC050550 TaxID=3154937 RepID=UPI0033D78E0D
MSTDLYGARVMAVAADRMSVRMRVFVVYYEVAQRGALALPDDPAFFLRLLSDWATDPRREDSGDRPLAEIELDQLLDEGWMAEHAAEYVRQVDRVAERNAVPTAEDWEHLSDFYYERHGGWLDEHRLVQADYVVRVTDPRHLAGVEPGHGRATVWYPSPDIRVRSDDGPYVPRFSEPVAVIVPFADRTDGGQFACDLAFSDDGRYLAVAGQRGDVRVYDTGDWTERARFGTPHDLIGPSLMWVPGRHVITARPPVEYEPQVAWDVDAGTGTDVPVEFGFHRSRTGRHRVEYGMGPGVEFVSAPFTPDRTVLLGLDAEADASDEPPAAEAIRFSADESRMFALDIEEEHTRFSMLDPDTGRFLGVAGTSAEMVMDFAVSPDGAYLAIAEQTEPYVVEPTIRRVADGGELVLRAGLGRLTNKVDWSPDGRLLAVDLHNPPGDDSPSELRIFPVGVLNEGAEAWPEGGTARAGARSQVIGRHFAEVAPGEGAEAWPEGGTARAGARSQVIGRHVPDVAPGEERDPLADGAGGEAVERLRRVAAGEDSSAGPWAAVALSRFDGAAGEAAPITRGMAAENAGESAAARAIYESQTGPAAALAKALLGRLLAEASDADGDADADARAEALDTGGDADADADGDGSAGADADARPGAGARADAVADTDGDGDGDGDGDARRARELLAEAQDSADPLASSYAGYVLGGMLIASGEARTAEAVLRRACDTALRTRESSYGLLPWIAVRLGELLAEREAGLEEIREAFALAQPLREIADPGLATVGLGVLDANPYAVRGALEWLRAWSGERHAHGCRLATRLGARIVEDSDDPSGHPLADLLRELDGSSESAAYALWLTARERRRAGGWNGALRAWADVADTGLLPYARWAGTCQAVLLTVRGDEPGARHALRHGRDDRLIVEIADALREAERNDDAMTAYTMATEGDDPRAVGRAWLGLGHVHFADGEFEDAAVAYRNARRLAEGPHATNAAYNLSTVLTKLGDTEGATEAARDAHRRAEAAGDPPRGRARTAQRLGDMLRHRRDWAGARDAYQAAVDAWREQWNEEYPFDARWALLHLAQVQGLLGERDSSRRILRKLLKRFAKPRDEEQKEIAVIAALAMALDAKHQRDLKTARPWFTRVIDSGDANHVPTALAHLAELHYWLGDKAEAARHYERVLELSDKPDYVAEAAYRLGEHLAETGDHARAIELMNRTLAVGFPAFDADAGRLLARLRTS